MPKVKESSDEFSDTAQNLDTPIVHTNLRGTFENPVIIVGNGTISLNLYGEDPAIAAARVAYMRQENGFFPSVGQISDQAAVVLHGCQFVVLRGFKFDDCWPAALYLNDCQHTVILDCDFGACTQAIGANGVDTRDIWVERCTFNQTRKNQLWDEIEWNQVHGSFENAAKGGVVPSDHRHLDGDFFRAWNIAGNVTIRDCDISDAFNGIHFFNSLDDLPADTDRSGVRFNNARRASVNVLIENNRFTNVRDNCIEPEDHAWNWVVRSNTFKDCLAPYSFELKRAGWFYIYDNHHWFEKSKDEIKGKRKSAAGFKFGGGQKNEGDFYIFNNSWLSHQGERLLRQRVLGRMKHFNNCIKMTNGRRRLFGAEWSKPDNGLDDETAKKAEGRRFTKRWGEFKIEMNGDWIFEKNGEDWRDYAIAGYPIGFQTVSNTNGIIF